MDISFRRFRRSDALIVSGMIKGLYSEDPSGKTMTDEKIRSTFAQLGEHSEQGTIMVLEKDGRTVGYSILVNYWSNEYGGNILFLDELYVIPSERRSGIGSEFIGYLKEKRPYGSVAILLEVHPRNVLACNFYGRAGFRPSRYDHYVLELSGH
ncbi:MAG: GNAT family N-acetyltransferase [Candidatus Thermoplasmatota archaeon]|jgi:GNAT superfamily N-acetyltransferase|nr:GNAT family N-acetyltransferase [Candidatus Thermoplasmatota archaeon]